MNWRAAPPTACYNCRVGRAWGPSALEDDELSDRISALPVLVIPLGTSLFHRPKIVKPEVSVSPGASSAASAGAPSGGVPRTRSPGRRGAMFYLSSRPSEDGRVPVSFEWA